MWKEGFKRGQSRRPDHSRSKLNKRQPEVNERRNQQSKSRTRANQTERSKSKPEKRQERQAADAQLLAGDGFINDWKALLKACEAHQLLKVSKTTVRFDHNIVLNDISIKSKGPQEDMIYAAKKGIHVNVRRGNTLLELKDQDAVIVGRKGLRKFYDLYPEYLEFNLGTLESLDGKIGIKEANENKSIHKKIFGEAKAVYDSMAGGIVIIEANKANGENCQISWIQQANAWLISSKNVAMLLRTVDDIQFYIGDRFHYAEIISREWFASLKKLKETQIDAIKDCLKDHTIVGEYVGNQTYQHLVKYERQGFLFYALVGNNFNDEAVNPKDALERIKSLGLQTVSYREHPVCKTWPELNQKLKSLYKEVKESPIEAREEGVVLYLVKKYNNGHEDLVGLCKLKTLEYQVYRKLREKLKGVHDKNTSRAQVETQFELEVKELVGDAKLPQELAFYLEVAKRAFDFAEKNEDALHLVFGQFVTFLSVMVYCCVNQLPPGLGYFEKSVAGELYATPWSRYPELKKKLKVSESFTPKTPRTIVFIPLTLPGMGKTYLYREVIKPYCEENGLVVRQVCSDALRKTEMDKLRLTMPTASDRVLYNKSREAADEAFNKTLIHHLKEKSLEEKVIFIDKNHPPNLIKKTIELIHAHKPKHADVRLLAVLPKTKNGLVLKSADKEFTFPISPEICLSSLVSVENRTGHETLNGSGVDSSAIVLLFYNLYRDFKFDGAVLKEYGFNGGFNVDFFTENFSFSKDALEKLSEILLKLQSPGDKPKDIQLLDQLLGLMQDNFFNPVHNRPSKEVQTKCVATVIKSLPVERPAPPPSLASKIQPQTKKQSGPAPAPKTPELPMNLYWAEATKNNEKALKAVSDSAAVVAISKKEYKPKKLPLYLGLFTKLDEKLRLQNAARYALAKIHRSHPDSQLQEDLAEFAQEALAGWRWPEDGFHVTTCSLGRDKPSPASDCFKSFEEGLSFPFKFRHLVYLPGQLLFGVVYLNRTQIKVENKFPHLTIATKALQAQDINAVLEAMFGGVFYPKYLAGLEFGADKVSTLTISLAGQATTVYLFELPQDLAFEAETRAVPVPN